MRVLLRFLSSLPGLATVSEAISIVSSTKFPPESFMQIAPYLSVIPSRANLEAPPDYFLLTLSVAPSGAGLRCVPVRNIQASFVTQIGPTNK